MKFLAKLVLVGVLALFITILPSQAEAGIFGKLWKVASYPFVTVKNVVAAIYNYDGSYNYDASTGGRRHAAIVIDGSEQFGTFSFDGAERSRLKFEVYVPFINPDLIPSYVEWHWGSQSGRFSLIGKKWPIGRTRFEVGTIVATQSYYEDELVVEVYYDKRLSRYDHNGVLHYQHQRIEKPLAIGTLNVVSWGERW